MAEVKRPEFVKEGISTRSLIRGVPPYHFVIPEAGGTGFDGDALWCSGGTAHIETPHPRSKLCSKCAALARQYWEEYSDDDDEDWVAPDERGLTQRRDESNG